MLWCLSLGLSLIDSKDVGIAGKAGIYGPLLVLIQLSGLLGGQLTVDRIGVGLESQSG